MTLNLQPDHIDGLIHERVRLSIVSTLAMVSEMSFNELKKTLGVTDGNLSAHARKLEDAGYIEIDKSFVNRRPRTVLRLTKTGHEAYRAYLELLKKIINSGPE